MCSLPSGADKAACQLNMVNIAKKLKAAAGLKFGNRFRNDLPLKVSTNIVP